MENNVSIKPTENNRHRNKLLLFDFYGTLIAPSGYVRLNKGVANFLSLAKDRGARLGVVTSCEEKEIVDFVLRKEGVRNAFSFIITGEDSKLHEERIRIAMETANKLSEGIYEPQDTYHFDDDGRRITGTHKNGAHHIMVVDAENLSAFAFGSDFLIKDFSDVNILENIFGTNKKIINTKLKLY